MSELHALTWPFERLGEAIEALACTSDLLSRANRAPNPPAMASPGLEQIDTWIKTTASHLGVEAEDVMLSYDQVEAALGHTGPAILSLPSDLSDGNQLRFLAVLGGRRGQTRVLDPRRVITQVSSANIRQAYCRRLEAPHIAGTQEVLDAAGVPVRSQAKAQSAMLRAQLARQPIRGMWTLCLPIGAPVGRLLRHLRLPQTILSLVCVHALQYALWIMAWWLMGSRALQGHIDRTWIITWALLLLTLIPFRMLSTWLQGLVAIRLGGLLKQRLLAGALNQDPDDSRTQGIGQLLGRVLEADTLETLALNGGFLGLVALIELAFAIVVLSSGAGGWPHALLLGSWLLAIAGLSWCYVRRRQGWTLARRSMTHDLVERMVGHRTRLAQERRETWHQSEDHAVESYVRLARPMDAIIAAIHSMAPRG